MAAYLGVCSRNRSRIFVSWESAADSPGTVEYVFARFAAGMVVYEYVYTSVFMYSVFESGLAPIDPSSIYFIGSGYTNYILCFTDIGFLFPVYDPTEGMGIIGFVTLYILGAYLSAQQISLSWKWCVIGLVINNLSIFISKVLLGYVADTYHLTVGTGLLYHYNTLFELLNAILLFLLLKQIPFKRGQKIITWGASSVFAVYLLHEHPLVRQVLWQSGLLPILQQSTFPQFVALTCMIPLAILCVGIVIDKLVSRLVLDPITRSNGWNRLVRWCQQAEVLFPNTENICQPR